MQNAFNPQDLDILAKIVDQACKSGCDDAQREAIAIRVISFALGGVRDYDALLAIAMGERSQSPS